MRCRVNVFFLFIKFVFLMWEGENFKFFFGKICSEIGDGGILDLELLLNGCVFLGFGEYWKF